MNEDITDADSFCFWPSRNGKETPEIALSKTIKNLPRKFPLVFGAQNGNATDMFSYLDLRLISDDLFLKSGHVSNGAVLIDFKSIDNEAKLFALSAIKELLSSESGIEAKVVPGNSLAPDTVNTIMKALKTESGIESLIGNGKSSIVRGFNARLCVRLTGNNFVDGLKTFENLAETNELTPLTHKAFDGVLKYRAYSMLPKRPGNLSDTQIRDLMNDAEIISPDLSRFLAVMISKKHASAATIKSQDRETARVLLAKTGFEPAALVEDFDKIIGDSEKIGSNVRAAVIDILEETAAEASLNAFSIDNRLRMTPPAVGKSAEYTKEKEQIVKKFGKLSGTKLVECFDTIGRTTFTAHNDGLFPAALEFYREKADALASSARRIRAKIDALSMPSPT